MKACFQSGGIVWGLRTLSCKQLVTSSIPQGTTSSKCKPSSSTLSFLYGLFASCVKKEDSETNAEFKILMDYYWAYPGEQEPQDDIQNLGVYKFCSWCAHTWVLPDTHQSPDCKRTVLLLWKQGLYTREKISQKKKWRSKNWWPGNIFSIKQRQMKV